ncbi:MAG: LUD domain-containing protein, partial [Bacteroidales bacterium]|nr:LUD domain-containing protein [Bacteroidales bacterium]
MSSKSEILGRLRANVRETYDMPDLSFKKLTFEDPVAEFIKQTTTTAGAKLVELKPTDDINEKIREAFPNAKVIASNLPGVKADKNPDEVERAQDLDGTDVGVIEGGVACAENACVWVPMNMKQKAICFISESLILIVSKKNIVSNMHDAYKKLEEMGETSKYGFGTFISGPSKTADIEQTLVYGAQAATALTVFL